MAQSWPGSPWGGLVPATVVPPVGAAVAPPAGAGEPMAGICKLGCGSAGVVKGAPTSISQRWPGWPCEGFRAALAAGAVLAGVTFVVFWPFSDSPLEQPIKVKVRATINRLDAFFIFRM